MSTSEESFSSPSAKLTVSSVVGAVVDSTSSSTDSSAIVAVVSSDTTSATEADVVRADDPRMPRLQFINTRFPVYGAGDWVTIRVDGVSSSDCEVEVTSAAEDTIPAERIKKWSSGYDGYWLVAVPIPTFYLNTGSSKEWRLMWSDGVSVIDTVFYQSSAQPPTPTAPPIVDTETGVFVVVKDKIEIPATVVEEEKVIATSMEEQDLPAIEPPALKVPGEEAGGFVVDGVTLTNEFMFVWGYITINGAPAPIGTVVEARVADLKVGSFVVSTPGAYGSMPAYGDDPYTTKKDGAQSGDIVYLWVNGEPTGSAFKYGSSFGDILHLDIALVGATGPVDPDVRLDIRADESLVGSTVTIGTAEKVVLASFIARATGGDVIADALDFLVPEGSISPYAPHLFTEVDGKQTYHTWTTWMNPGRVMHWDTFAGAYNFPEDKDVRIYMLGKAGPQGGPTSVEPGSMIQVNLLGGDNAAHVRYTLRRISIPAVDGIPVRVVTPVVETEPVETELETHGEDSPPVMYDGWRMPLWIVGFSTEKPARFNLPVIGQAVGATDGYDGEELELEAMPPPPPSDCPDFAFHLYNDLRGRDERTICDVRSEQDRDMEFVLHFQTGWLSVPFQMTWDTNQLPPDATGEVAFIFRDNDGIEVIHQTYADIWDGEVALPEQSFAMKAGTIMFLIHRNN